MCSKGEVLERYAGKKCCHRSCQRFRIECDGESVFLKLTHLQRSIAVLVFKNLCKQASSRCALRLISFGLCPAIFVTLNGSKNQKR